jgi:hypothetical protein
MINVIYLKNGFKMVADHTIISLLGYQRFLKIDFRRNFGYPLNLENPETLAEKVKWILVNGNLTRFSKFVDKYSVREFVREKIGEEYLIPLIGIYNTADDIDFDSLPGAFVMKATHGSSWNITVKDKSKLNWKHLKKRMNRWIRANYFYRHGETNYKTLKGRVMIEEYLEDPTGDLKDYKFYCKNGEPMFIQIDSNRFTDHKGDMYDSEWNRLPLKWGIENLPQPLAKPERLEEMFAISRKLASRFPFVRVDLYCPGDRIYFGELTFTPGDGEKPVSPAEYNYLLGEVIDIKHYNDEIV